MSTGGRWEFYRDTRGAAIAKLEMFGLIDAGTSVERGDRRAVLWDLMGLAEAGDLLWDDEIKDVERVGELWELRWELTPFATEEPPVVVRLYFAEPRHDTTMLLALHFHFKAIRGLTEGQIRAEQNRAIDEADRRRLDWLRRTPGTGY